VKQFSRELSSAPKKKGEFQLLSDECNDLAAALSVSIIDTFGRKHSRGLRHIVYIAPTDYGTWPGNSSGSGWESPECVRH